MTYEEVIAQARQKCEAAEREVSRIENEIAAAKNAARQSIDEEYAERLGAATAARRDAAKALRETKDALLPNHPWTGKRVFSMRRVGDRWNRKMERVEGIVETCRSTTAFPPGQRYGLPMVGDGFVRQLKKDGKPSLRFWDLDKEWQLVEPTDA